MRRYRYWLFVGLTAFAAFGLVMLLTTHGPGVTPDSVAYLSAADSLLRGEGFLQYTGAPLTEWPPLFPAILAGASLLTGTSPASAARLINAAALAGIMVVAGIWLARYVAPIPIRLATLTVLLFSAALWAPAALVWSEPLFILLSLLSLLLLDVYRADGRLRWLILAGAAAGLAALTRYIGVVLIPVGGWIALADRRLPRRRRLEGAAAFGLIALLPVGAWLVRNRALTGMLTGERGASTVSLGENLIAVANVLSIWASPLLLGLMVLLLVVLIRRLIRRPASAKWRAMTNLGLSSLRSDPALAGAASLLLLFVLIYLAFIVIWRSVNGFDPIDSRLLSPLYVPLIFLIAMLTAALWAGWPRRRAVAGLALVASVWVLLSLLGTVVTVYSAQRRVVFGAYGGPEWTESPLAAVLRREPPRGPIYSNAPDAVYYLTGLFARESPRRVLYATTTPTYDLELLDAVLASEGEVALVWFSHDERDFRVALDDLAAYYRLEPIVEVEDGGVYRLSARRQGTY